MENATTKFNMSAATLMRLDELLRKAMACYYSGNLKGYFFALKNVKLQSMFKFNEDERKKLYKYEVAFSKEKTNSRRWLIIEKYNECLLDYMDKYGLLLPNKIDDSNTAY